ncbi:hypothetical protein MMC26_001492 [Xylographa opegraphella]|nr:hypothetical protein [Xylographa opegraphella]
MPPPPHTPTTTRALLRALLRECTYLPDPSARTYWHSRISTRFRQHHPHPHPPPWWTLPPPRRSVPRPRPLTPSQRGPLLRQAHRLLRTLRRATAGHRRPLALVLQHTYGRTGRRRHELLAVLARLDAPADTAGVQRLAAALAAGKDVSPPSSFSSSSPLLLPRTVELVLRAQRAQPAANLSRSPPKTLRPTIPLRNSWGRPVPRARVRAMQRRWVQRARASVLPPLPRAEWERLRGLAAGRGAWGGAVMRRAGAGPGRGDGVGRTGWERRAGAGNPHVLSRRFMRRMWERVFVQCPVMEWDAGVGGWMVKWGEVERGRRGARGVGPMFLFEGVDEEGRRVG